MRWQIWAGALVWGLAVLSGGARAEALKAQQIVEARPGKGADPRALAAKVQILLDRAHFSPGVIDGRMGENVENALASFRDANQLRGTDKPDKSIDEATFAKLAELGRESQDPVIVEYAITEDDVKGPFTKKIPDDLEEQAKLERLGYTGPSELLAEKFHMDEDFLKELNPGKDFDKAGTTIMVAKVDGPAPGERGAVKRIELDKARKQLRALGDNDRLIAVYPATIGSKSRPAPTGELKVTGTAKNPKYTYNPEYKFEGVKATKPFDVAPGPNNPVGLVWIALSLKGYGIHGASEPEKVGRDQTHGCVRLTNWDALALSRLIKKGTPVQFVG
jgi:lipoprotein-anchoring transpeptidase ErfK/SrfK